MNKNDLRFVVIIPALNESQSIAKVIADIPIQFTENIVVVDNCSTDNTALIAEQSGAKVVRARKKGYGYACLEGIKFARKMKPDVFIFLDGDYSDFPADMTAIVDHLAVNNLDMVLGSRTSGLADHGSLLPQARIGNWVATNILSIFYDHSFTDLGPFRAIRASALEKLNMQDENFGWTMEMQIKALNCQLKIGEVPVRYRKRTGKSKISGTLKGSVLAGFKILSTIIRYAQRRRL